MRKFFIIFLLLLVFSSCSHPQLIASPSVEPPPNWTKIPAATEVVGTASVVTKETPSSISALITPGWLVFVSYRDHYPVLYAMKEDCSELTKLLDSLSGIGHPSWSPDGNKILFHANSPHDGVGDIFVMNSDGSGITNLTNHPDEDFDPAWSPDGKRIAFISNREGNVEIFIMNADGSGLTRLTHNLARHHGPTWSPDGSRIAFESDMNGIPEIYVINTDGTRQTRLTDNPTGDSGPSWSPDGAKIAFVSDRDGDGDIYVMNADGSNPVNLTQDSDWNFSPAWSPDGRQIAFPKSSREKEKGIYVMNADGSAQTWLANTQQRDASPAWYPAVDPAIAARLSFGPTVTVPAPSADVQTQPGDEVQAQEALLTFINLLHSGQYTEAAKYYGGSYELLIDMNPPLDPRDHPKLLQHGCEINGLECLQVRSVKLQEQVKPAEYKFMVEFEYDDGSLFALGPCCGGSETDTPSRSQFEYVVIKNSEGWFLVQNLPIYAG